MEMMDANGDWVRVPEDRQLPTPADYVPRSFVVDLTGLFPEDASNYYVRINNFWNVTFDYIGIDTTPQTDIIVQRINGDATLHQAFTTPSSSTGAFTKYGNVTNIVLEGDDMYAIGRQGDQVSLQFPANSLSPLEDGMERDFFMFVACWFKDPPGNWGYGFDFTVDPLPFRNMSGFPYPDTENYPSDQAHTGYLQEYNIRILPILTTQWIVGDLLVVIISLGLVIAGTISTLIWIKPRVRRFTKFSPK